MLCSGVDRGKLVGAEAPHPRRAQGGPTFLRIMAPLALWGFRDSQEGAVATPLVLNAYMYIVKQNICTY